MDVNEKDDEPLEEPATTNTIADELSRLSALEFDLLLFLIAAHHGKVRLSMQSSPKDQEFETENARWAGTGMPIRGVRQGDEMLPTKLPDSLGAAVEMPMLTLHLDVAAIGLSERYGRSWTERMMGLLSQYSPFGLGYLEAIIRAADVRASRLTTPDPELANCTLEIGAADQAQADDTTEVEVALEADELVDESEISIEEEIDV